MVNHALARVSIMYASPTYILIYVYIKNKRGGLYVNYKRKEFDKLNDSKYVKYIPKKKTILKMELLRATKNDP